MAVKRDLREWVLEALKRNGGRASIVEVCKHIWENHQTELRRSKNLFYTWQYDVRWVAHQLRKEGIVRSQAVSPKGMWELEEDFA